MSYPKLIVDLEKLENNVKSVRKYCGDIKIAGVTKVFCGHPEIAKAYIAGGVKYLADSRVENLKKLQNLDIEKIMLRLPMPSEAEEVVKYSDISLNSELKTLQALSDAAKKLDKVHKVILMVDLGDLREGYFREEMLYNDLENAIEMKNLKIIGIGTNMACYGGVIPEKESIKRLEEIKSNVESKFDIKLELISGGNSSALHLIEKGEFGVVNNIRLGESLVVGTEPSYDKRIPGTVSDVFELQAEIIEIKEKPSIPNGKIGKDAFGNIPSFEDRGIRKRMICAIGKQDVDFGSLKPQDSGVDILGGSSDHLILDGTDSKIDYEVGDRVSFSLEYVSILRTMTSEYVTKELI